MAKSLKNIQAIRQMLSGTHRTQTKTTVGWNATKPNITRKVGDKWEEVDSNGMKWICEQKEGYVDRQSPASYIISKLRKEYEFPSTCPKCKNHMKDNKYNRKMWAIHKTCFDCVIEMEHELKITGKYEEYERERIQKNILSWLDDVSGEVEEIKKILTEDTTYTNSDGTVEVWRAPFRDNKEYLYELVEKDFNSLREKLLSYGNTEE